MTGQDLLALIVAGHVATGEPWEDSIPLPPAAWDNALAAYEAALANEKAHWDSAIAPRFDDSLPVGPERSAALDTVPQAAWDEDERLSQIRYDAEDALMDCPAPNAVAFARKVRLARADQRAWDGCDDILVRDAEAIIAGKIA
jgi:hypothetical protein